MNKLLFTWVEFLYSPGFLWPWHEWTWLTCLNSKSFGRAFTAKEDIMAPLQQRSKWWEDAHFDEVFFRLGWNHQLVSLCVCVVQGKHSTATRSQSRIVAEAAGGKDASRDNGLHIPTLDKLSSFGGYLGRKPGSRLTTWALDEWF